MKLYSLLFLSAAMLFACKNGDDLPEIITSNFTTSIAENPVAGQSLGTISAAVTAGSLDYQITSQEPEDAMVIDATSGELTVATPISFDFEKRPNISATVTVTSGDVQKEVNVLIGLIDVKAPMVDQLMFAKNYKTSRFSWDGIFAMLGSHDCRLDDEMDVNIDGTYLYNGGSSLCGEEDDQRLKTGNWDLDENLKFVIFDKSTESQFRADLDFLSDTLVALSGSYFGVPVSGEYVPK